MTNPKQRDLNPAFGPRETLQRSVKVLIDPLKLKYVDEINGSKADLADQEALSD